MNPKHKEQFNQMRLTLKKIATVYQTTKQLRKRSRNDWGVQYEEALEMAYENIQIEAKNAIRGVREA